MSDLQNVLSESASYYLEEKARVAARLALLPKGTIKQKKIGGRLYYYLSYRQGKKIVDKYLGAAAPEELRGMLEERKALMNRLKEIKASLALLRRPAGASDLNKAIIEVLRTLSSEGLWDSGLEIIGSWCFLIYQKHLPLERYPLRTQDIDILIPLPYKGRRHDLPRILRQLGFSESYHPDGSSLFTGGGLRIEFVSPRRGRTEASAARVPDLKVTSQLLRYTDLLTSQTMILKVAQGAMVRLPAPAAFLLHKLIIATLWQRSEKQAKDLRQALAVARFVLQNQEQRRRLGALWSGLLPGWRKKAASALRKARELIPLEAGVADSLAGLLT
jgi:hypothetical protein